ncbi:MAG: FAD-dependent oxidoreductase [Candidatus Acidiferrales bacterium]
MPDGKRKSYDVAVIGAGVFGSWTAYCLRKAGASVLLLDSYGPAHSRASSGGESRIIRMGYGPDEIYTRWSLRALPLWQELFAEAGHPGLFHRTGVLWIADEREREPYARETVATLANLRIPFEKLTTADLRHRYPQIAVDDSSWGIIEPSSGVLMARRAVQTVADQAQKIGVDYKIAAIAPPAPAPALRARLHSLSTTTGENISAATFVFACGPWLPKLFPALLGDRIFTSRQEIFFFGVPPGDVRFQPPALPTWLVLRDEFYGMPDLESRGFKVANDRHGPPVDPDTQSRIATPEGLAAARDFLARRFPALKDAPVVETRVCQYENTSNGDFLIDQHPDFENVWLVGGGSGHGFKHGPSVGEYITMRVLKAGAPGPAPLEPLEWRFSLATKESAQHRAVF